jgi:two-component system, cell cycle sensor histidine kinase and response regulator CckA
MSRQILDRLGYTVLVAENPGEALLLAEEYNGTIDLLITDVVMPDMNGRDLASHVTMNRPG